VRCSESQRIIDNIYKTNTTLVKKLV